MVALIHCFTNLQLIYRNQWMYRWFTWLPEWSYLFKHSWILYMFMWQWMDRWKMSNRYWSYNVYRYECINL